MTCASGGSTDAAPPVLELVASTCAVDWRSAAATAAQAPGHGRRVSRKSVVTAQRVESDIQTTPIAVTALTGDFLTQYSYDRVTSLAGAVPNLNFSASTGGASSQVSAFIRGVGEFDFLITTDPAVGLYIDGVYLARTFGTNLDFAEPERVEVLRGPQGTLFGKNNIGGAINVVTRQPEGDGRVRAELEYGSYSSWRALADDGHRSLGQSRAAAHGRRQAVRRLAGTAR